MKKLLLMLCALCMMTLSANAWEASERVETVGKTLLEKNGLPTAITFEVVEGIADNSQATTTNIINISKDDLTCAGNDSEVAAVVANEIGYIINGQTSKNKMRELAKQAITSKLSADNLITTAANSEYITNKTNLNDEKAADITGLDLMCQTGYNPLAMVVLITKRPTTSTLETLQGKPNNSERAMNAFDYLTYVYPAKVSAGYGCQEYRNFLAYANPIVEDRNANSKKLAKFNKQQAKNQAQRAKDIAKYKSTGLSDWDISYQLLQSFTATK
jgi:hypothetical protein